MRSCLKFSPIRSTRSAPARRSGSAEVRPRELRSRGCESGPARSTADRRGVAGWVEPGSRCFTDRTSTSRAATRIVSERTRASCRGRPLVASTRTSSDGQNTPQPSGTRTTVQHASSALRAVVMGAKGLTKEIRERTSVSWGVRTLPCEKLRSDDADGTRADYSTGGPQCVGRPEAGPTLSPFCS
jgi:hypothetical protein